MTTTAAPVCADPKHSFPILGPFRSHATGEKFGFPAISTADETPGTPQTEPAKLAQVEVLPQLVVEGQSCQVAVGRLERTEICVGEECEYVEDELVI